MQRDKQRAKERTATAATADGHAGITGGGGSGGGGSGGGRRDYWLAAGIVVKVMSKELKEYGYYKQKVGVGDARLQAEAEGRWYKKVYGYVKLKVREGSAGR